MANKEKLLDLIEKIIKSNILSKKELKMKIAPILVKNNDSRRVGRLVVELLEGKIDEIKDQDVENLLETLNGYANDVGDEKQDSSDEEKILLENYKLTELYNQSIIKIQKLEDELKSKKGDNKELGNKLNQLESRLKKFEGLNIEKIIEENKLYSSMLKITDTQIIEVPDEDINALYIRYKIQGTKKFEKAFVTEDEIIPKSYYDLKGGK